MADKKKDLIDLDNLDAADDSIKVVEQQDEIGVVGGLVAKPSGNQIDSIYDRYKKMIFLFDVSGSMGEGMVPDEIEAMYHWSDVVLKQFRDALIKDIRKAFERRYMDTWAKNTDAQIDAKIDEEITALVLRQLESEVDEDIDADQKKDLENDAKLLVAGMSADEKLQNMWFLSYGIPMNDDFELKLYIIRQSLPQVFGIKLIPTGIEGKSMRKIDVMQAASSQFIEERFTKCPDALVLAYQFDDSIDLITKDCTKNGLLEAIKKIYPRGGTNIFDAIRTALTEFKVAPSALAAHHIVLVTDAESTDGEKIEKIHLVAMKNQNVVLDFIKIKGTGSWGGGDQYQASSDAIKRVCEATGGDYVEVNTPSEFNKKFLAAAGRLMLPPAR